MLLIIQAEGAQQFGFFLDQRPDDGRRSRGLEPRELTVTVPMGSDPVRVSEINLSRRTNG
jgi:hypothetical protein